MARTRSIKPEFWSDEKLARLSRDARLTFVGLWSVSDDYGVAKGHPAWLRSQLFPYDEELKLSQFKKWLDEIECIGIIIPFTENDESYYYIRHFSDHQKVDHPSKLRNPEPPSDILARFSRESRVETETETETETLTRSQKFEKFYLTYPKKKSRGDAERAFSKINPDETLLGVILQALDKAKKSEDWIKDKGRYIPYPATWLNAKCWLDEIETQPDNSQRASPVFKSTVFPCPNCGERITESDLLGDGCLICMRPQNAQNTTA